MREHGGGGALPAASNNLASVRSAERPGLSLPFAERPLDGSGHQAHERLTRGCVGANSDGNSHGFSSSPAFGRPPYVKLLALLRFGYRIGAVGNEVGYSMVRTSP
jgi:hypothetical protein